MMGLFQKQVDIFPINEWYYLAQDCGNSSLLAMELPQCFA